MRKRPPLYSVEGTRGRLGNLSRTTIERLIKVGELETIRFGRRYLITDESIEKLISRRKAMKA